MLFSGGGGQSAFAALRHSAHAVDLSNEPPSRPVHTRRLRFSALHGQTQSRTHFPHTTGGVAPLTHQRAPGTLQLLIRYAKLGQDAALHRVSEWQRQDRVLGGDASQRGGS